MMLVAILFLFLSIYGIMGLYFYAGELTNFCFDHTGISHWFHNVLHSTGALNPDPDIGYLLCSPGGSGRVCPANYTCLKGTPMLTNDFGVSLFDNIGWSMLMVFQTITVENWSVLMQHVCIHIRDFLLV